MVVDLLLGSLDSDFLTLLGLSKDLLCRDLHGRGILVFNLLMHEDVVVFVGYYFAAQSEDPCTGIRFMIERRLLFALGLLLSMVMQ
jgi:hypothetical protein